MPLAVRCRIADLEQFALPRQANPLMAWVKGTAVNNSYTPGPPPIIQAY